MLARTRLAMQSCRNLPFKAVAANRIICRLDSPQPDSTEGTTAIIEVPTPQLILWGPEVAISSIRIPYPNMADTPPAPSSGATTPPSSAAEQARIRKERREAKIRAGGSARLNKITGLGGGIQRGESWHPRC
jgi:hypothetical protein